MREKHTGTAGVLLSEFYKRTVLVFKDEIVKHENWLHVKKIKSYTNNKKQKFGRIDLSYTL